MSSKEDVLTLFRYFAVSGIPAEVPRVTEGITVAEFEAFVDVCNIDFGSFVVLVVVLRDDVVRCIGMI